MPPLTKTCPKMVLSDKGGSLCVKDVFAKKFFGARRDSAGGALASVLRKHSSEGRTPDAVERCVRTCRPDSETAPVKANSCIYRATDIRLRATKPTPKTCYTSSVILGLGGKPHEAAGLHRTCRQRYSRMAPRGARAAGRRRMRRCSAARRPRQIVYLLAGVLEQL